MNKFAFQNNARQSHLPASLAARPPPARSTPHRPSPPSSGHLLLLLLLRAVGHHVPRVSARTSPRTPSPAYNHVLRPPPASPLSMRRGTHYSSTSLAHTATRATPQPYFFHSVLSIDQVLNFRVHPSRASTSSSSASSSASASSY